MRPVPVPTEVERLANLLLGSDDNAPRLPAPGGRSPREVLEQALLPAVQRAPCFVSFSGGRDSSAILAVATETARRHRLPDPIPASMRFPGAPETDETSWQQLVVDHLGLGRHEVVELSGELDALGPAATEVLREHGVRWPGNAYMHAPLLELARGGSLLTGTGGDELFGTTGARPSRMPRAVRAARWRRASAPAYPWLTSRSEKWVHTALAREETSWPPRWDRSVHHWYRSRSFAAVDGVLALIAATRDVHVVNPFLAPAVLAALARTGGASGFASRDAAMTSMFGDLLPDAVLTRVGKAGFSAPVFGERVRAFAERWDGSGVDPRLVRVDELRAQWLSDRPDFRTILLLHQAAS